MLKENLYSASQPTHDEKARNHIYYICCLIALSVVSAVLGFIAMEAYCNYKKGKSRPWLIDSAVFFFVIFVICLSVLIHGNIIVF